MKVTLIRPPAYSAGLMGAQLVPFLGVAYLGACARAAGHTVDIIDMCGEDIDHTEVLQGKYTAYGMTYAALRKRLRPSEVIGFTSTFSQDWPFHRRLIQYVRRLSPESMLIAGGEHVSALAQFCLEDCPELDISVVGEGEEVLVKLLEAIEKGSELSEVPSLIYRRPDNDGYAHTPRASRIKDVDQIPFPAWDLTPMENYLSRRLNYHIQRGRTIPMLASRGCPYSCTFCSNSNMWGAPWLVRSPNLVVDEMEYYIQRYQANNFVFSDLTAVVTKKSIVELCTEIIKRKINVTWQLPTLRTEAVDDNVLELMYQAGCRDLDFAIESGSKDVLAIINKKNNPKKMFALIKDGLNVGMNLSSNIIVGLPGEGPRQFLSTYWLTVKLALSGLQEINALPFVPYPGSKLFSDFLKAKKIILNDDYFSGLFAYTDFTKATSWSEHFGPKTLNFIRLFLMLNFYSLMFISHPWRIVRLGINALSGRTTTKLEGVLKRAFKNISSYFFCKTKNAEQNI